MADYVLVTGASGNLGRAIVDACSAAGMSVIAHSRTADNTSLSTSAAHQVAADLTDEVQVSEMFTAIRGVLGDDDQLIGVVANAADQQTGPITELTSSNWHHMLDATLVSAVRTVSGALPLMTQGERW